MNLARASLILFVVALGAAVIGFGGSAGAAADIARVLFVVALILLLLSTIVHLLRRPLH